MRVVHGVCVPGVTRVLPVCLRKDRMLPAVSKGEIGCANFVVSLGSPWTGKD